MNILKQGGYINTILTLLRDKESLVVLAALSLVRNIASLCDNDITCKLMESIDFLVELLVHTNVQTNDDSTTLRFKNQMLENILMIFTYFVLSSGELGAQFNRQDGFYVQIMRVFKSGHYDSSKIAAAQLLLTIVESLANNIPLMLQKEHISLLKGAMASSNNSALLRSLIITILAEQTPSDDLPVLLKTTLPIMGQVLEWDAKLELSNFLTQESPKESLNDWTDKVQAQCIILETLANILVVDEEDSNGFVEMEEDDNFESNLNNGLSANVVDLLEQNYNLFQLIAQKSYFYDPFEATKSQMSLLQLQARASACFQNIITLGIFDNEPSFPKDLQSLWTMMCGLCDSSLKNSCVLYNEDMLQILTSTSAIMVHILKFSLEYRQQVGSDPLIISENDVQGIVGMVNNFSLDEQVRANATSMLSSVGQKDLSIDILGSTLVERLYDTSLWVIAEAANALMDIFPEPNYNHIVQSLNMLPKIKEIVPKIRQVIKTQTETLDRILLDRLDETCFNLQRFLKYKESQ